MSCTMMYCHAALIHTFVSYLRQGLTCGNACTVLRPRMHARIYLRARAHTHTRMLFISSHSPPGNKCMQACNLLYMTTHTHMTHTHAGPGNKCMQAYNRAPGYHPGMHVDLIKADFEQGCNDPKDDHGIIATLGLRSYVRASCPNGPCVPIFDCISQNMRSVVALELWCTWCIRCR